MSSCSGQGTFRNVMVKKRLTTFGLCWSTDFLPHNQVKMEMFAINVLPVISNSEAAQLWKNMEI